MPWHRGMLHSLRTASHFLRLNVRGLQYSAMDELLEPSPTAWTKMSCLLNVANASHNGAFCKEAQSGMLLFPTGPVTVPDNVALSANTYNNNYLQYFGQSSPCNRTHTGRKQIMSDQTYDISLCDLFDNNLDMIFVDYPEQIVYWRIDNTSAVILFMFGVLSIYMVSCIAQNVVASIQQKESRVPLAQRLVVMLTILTLAWTFAIEGNFVFIVTASDRILFWHLMLYTIFELVYQMWIDQERETQKNSTQSKQACMFASSISLLTTSLLLITVRIHYTFDNPYIAVLTTIFGMRTFYKFFVFNSHSILEHVLHTIDVFIFASLLGNGVMRTDLEIFESVLNMIIVLFISCLVGGLLSVYNKAFIDSQ